MDDSHIVAIVIALVGSGGAFGAFVSFRLGLKQAKIKEKSVDRSTGLELIKKAFTISEQLQENLKRDLDDLRQQVKDTQSLVTTLVEENKKLLLENDKLMRANHQLTEENNMLLKENKALSEQILTVTERMQTLEKAIHASPNVIDEIDRA